jgi:hypothetical protein
VGKQLCMPRNSKADSKRVIAPVPVPGARQIILECRVRSVLYRGECLRAIGADIPDAPRPIRHQRDAFGRWHLRWIVLETNNRAHSLQFKPCVATLRGLS